MLGVRPFLGDNNTKEKIVSLLGREWPLTAKKIYNILKHDSNVSYQAMHKTLRELQNRGVLERKETSYRLNLDWVKSLRRETNAIEKRYSSIRSSEGVKTFSSLYSMQEFFLELALEEQGENVSMRLNHLPAFFAGHSHYQKFKELGTRKKTHIFCHSTSPLDEWLAPHYTNAGYKVRLESSFSETDQLLSRDLTVQAFLPTQLKTLCDSLYSKPVQELDLSQLIDKALHGKQEIIAFTSSNGYATEKLLKQSISEYKDKP